MKDPAEIASRSLIRKPAGFEKTDRCEMRKRAGGIYQESQIVSKIVHSITNLNACSAAGSEIRVKKRPAKLC